MENLYFSYKPKPIIRNKVFAGILILLAAIWVVFSIAINSKDPSKFALNQYEIEEQEFLVFTVKFNKLYKSADEFNARFRIFRDNAAYTRVHNTLGKTYILGITQFADLTHDEFKALYTPNQYEYSPSDEEMVQDDTPVKAISQIFDWRTKGAVTPVKNQGQCSGSGWAFSATGAVEGTWFLAGHTLVSLSEQELVDCSASYGNSGCNGGLVTNAFKFVMKYGLTTEATYPYSAKSGQCQTSLESQPTATISNYSIVPANNPKALMQAVLTKPVSVAVQADQTLWQHYTGGIVTSDCGTNLDHTVLIVGFDTTSHPAYWIVKNSWGTGWGDQGYISIAISEGKGVCGINMTPSYPIA